MTSMTRTTVGVTGGVDTHGQSHHAAVIDHLGRQLDDREFPTSPAGYGALLEWLRCYGELDRIGVEGTSTYGAALTRHLREAGALVVEVDRPDRWARRAQDKSDPLDAYSAARAALSGAASVVPKRRDGRVEAIRALRVARSSAVKARSQATNQINALIVTGPAQLREQLRHLPTGMIIAACARLRPGHNLGDAEQATKTALRRLARRHQQLSEEIAEADHELDQLVHQVAPALLALPGVGPEVAGQVLTSAGDNPNRIKSEAAFAHLCGAAPIPASSGRTHRHRLNRGGDRGANNALNIVVLGRLRYDSRTHAYVDRRTQEGLSKPEIIRCLKRYVARELYNALPTSIAENRSQQPLPDHRSIDPPAGIRRGPWTEPPRVTRDPARAAAKASGGWRRSRYFHGGAAVDVLDGMIGLGGAGLGSESVRIMPALVRHPALATNAPTGSVHSTMHAGSSPRIMNELGHEVGAAHWCALVDPAT